jgi:hypothetical protein
VHLSAVILADVLILIPPVLLAELSHVAIARVILPELRGAS